MTPDVNDIMSDRIRMHSKLLPGFVLAILAVIMGVSPCFAHKVNVYAYVEAERLVVSGYFGAGAKAGGCKVEVNDPSGASLLTGKTDSDGICVFRIGDLPAGTKLVSITMEAGMGHKAMYEIDLSEEVATAGMPDKSRPTTPESYEVGPKSTYGHSPSLDMSQDELTHRLEQIIDRKLEPLFWALAGQQRAQNENKFVSRPGITEIIGGIGWIVGLAGIAAFALSKRRRS